MRAIQRSSVVLPLPLPPSTTTSSPAAMLRSKSASASLPSGYCIVRPRTRSMTLSQLAEVSSAELFKINVERLDEVADAVIGAVGLRHQPSYARADHDLAVR